MNFFQRLSFIYFLHAFQAKLEKLRCAVRKTRAMLDVSMKSLPFSRQKWYCFILYM